MQGIAINAIEGAVLPKKNDPIINLNTEQYCDDYARAFNQALDAQGYVRLTLYRGKLIDLIFLNTKKIHGWSCEKISHLHLDNPDRIIIESLADAIIANLKDLITVVKGE